MLNDSLNIFVLTLSTTLRVSVLTHLVCHVPPFPYYPESSPFTQSTVSFYFLQNSRTDKFAGRIISTPPKGTIIFTWVLSLAAPGRGWHEGFMIPWFSALVFEYQAGNPTIIFKYEALPSPPPPPSWHSSIKQKPSRETKISSWSSRSYRDIRISKCTT